MDPWELFTPAWTCGSLPARSPALYRQVVQALDVEHAERYRARDGLTWCNIFVGDATKANGCEIPHWLPGGRETTANGIVEWLEKHGRAHGWVKTDADHAKARASCGFPTVVVWRNPGLGSGHVAMVLPTPTGEPLRIAQAGRDNFFDGPIGRGFGDLAASALHFTHD